MAKAKLHNKFGNKEGLTRAYLRGRLTERQGRVNRAPAALAALGSPREQILAVFDVPASISAGPRFHGCAFANAIAESQPGSVAVEVSDARMDRDTAAAARAHSAAALFLQAATSEETGFSPWAGRSERARW